MMKPVFVDTSCWVGFFLARDQYHSSAVRLLDELEDAGRPLFTSDYVLAEAVTRLRKQGGHKIALRAWEELEDGELVHVVDVDRSHRREARRIFEKYDQLLLSLVDCVSLAVMKRLGIEEAATFDDDSRKLGCIVLPGSDA